MNAEIQRHITKLGMRISDAHIEQIKAYLVDKPVKSAYLFGSHVRGQAKADSDIDIVAKLV